MSDPLVNVTQRLPVSLVKTIDDEAKARAATFGMDVNRTDVIRSILVNHFKEKEARACQASPEAQTPK